MPSREYITKITYYIFESENTIIYTYMLLKQKCINVHIIKHKLTYKLQNS